MWKKLSLRAKLLAAFLVVGLVPFTVLGGVAVYRSSTALSNASFGQLMSLRTIKAAQIEQFFLEREGDMGVLMETVDAIRGEAFAKLEAVRGSRTYQIHRFFADRKNDMAVLARSEDTKRAFGAFKTYQRDSESPADGPLDVTVESYQSVWNAQTEFFEHYQKSYGYYDVFLIDGQSGQVLFTVAKESDLGSNLATGPYAESNLARMWRAVVETGEVRLVDMEAYAPSNGDPAMFVGAPIRGQGDEIIGVVASQISLDAINEIMGERSGMGATGESYLVGPDQKMRSDSFLDPTGHSVSASLAGSVEDNGVSTEAATRALAGETGAKVIIDYNHNPVLSAFAPLELDGFRWGVLSEIDVAEAFVPVDSSGADYYAKYIEKYGYYDLFLINPDGYCFYTVAHEADYQTNLVTGPYSSSNLGALVQQTLSDKSFGIVDFAPYAPSNGEPAAFIAEPVVQDGHVELVVAMQLSLDAINSIMQRRDGMGETGETYLVGADKLMRSDSFLDPKGHSVMASFANPSTGRVDTVASQEALAGKSGEQIIIDYNGNPVLSAYQPISVGDFTWALIAEIDRAEAFAAVYAIVLNVALVGLVGILAIVAIALLVARSIVNPIRRVIDGLSVGADQVSVASGQVAQSSQAMAEGASEQASALEETSASLEELTSMTRQNADNSNQANTMAKQASTASQHGMEAMDRMSVAIGKIKQSSDQTAKILKTIDEIAFQTNLLALNAAVEAARAGDAGKGFSVVAEEVRSLAQRSAEAARNTATLIDESLQNSEQGVDASGQVAGHLEQIMNATQKVSQLVAEVTAASNEQAQGIDQINTAVAEMDKVTQSNAASSEEAAAASEELSAQATELRDMVDMLAAVVAGSGVSTHGVQPPSQVAPPREPKSPAGAGPKAPEHKKSVAAPRLVHHNESIIPLDDEDIAGF